jgi:hypothetical protein
VPSADAHLFPHRSAHALPSRARAAPCCSRRSSCSARRRAATRTAAWYAIALSASRRADTQNPQAADLVTRAVNLLTKNGAVLSVRDTQLVAKLIRLMDKALVRFEKGTANAKMLQVGCSGASCLPEVLSARRAASGRRGEEGQGLRAPPAHRHPARPAPCGEPPLQQGCQPPPRGRSAQGHVCGNAHHPGAQPQRTRSPRSRWSRCADR